MPVFQLFLNHSSFPSQILTLGVPGGPVLVVPAKMASGLTAGPLSLLWLSHQEVHTCLLHTSPHSQLPVGHSQLVATYLHTRYIHSWACHFFPSMSVSLSSREEHWLGHYTWLWVLHLPFAPSTGLGKSLPSLNLFPHLQWEIFYSNPSEMCWDDWDAGIKCPV